MGETGRKSPVMMEQEQAGKIAEIGNEILRNARNELYLNMRFLDVALSSLLFTPDFSKKTWGTNGYLLAYNPEYLAGIYRKSRIYVNRAYLHIILHCLFCHMDTRGEKDKEYWNLSCDIAVESIIDGLYQKCVHIPMAPVRREFYMRIKDSVKVMNGESIYQYLKQSGYTSQRLASLAREFWVDDHSDWEDEKSKPKNPERKKKWDDTRNQMQTEMETFSKEASEDSKSLLDQVKIENRERYDYREFLRKFSALKEHMQVDTDSFDYIYYNYGMSLYGNMPLIEPLETKEVKRIEDFVIVIDTSMSCSGQLVKRFLEETYTILCQSESFFTKVNIHVIQCDEKVEHDQLITSSKELKDYMEHMEIIGQGGTDFRPAFQYVDQLIGKKVFHKLRGLIYFTDGYGMFPVKMPSYDTAFVFMKDDYSDADVPPWAIKIILDPEQLGDVKERTK